MREFEFSQREVEEKVKAREKEIEKINKIQEKLVNVTKCFMVFVVITLIIALISVVIKQFFEFKNNTFEVANFYTIIIELFAIFSFLFMLLIILSIRIESNIDKKVKLLKSLIIHEVINDSLLTTKDLVKPNSYIAEKITYDLLKTLDFTKDEKGNIEVDISFTNGYMFPSWTKEKKNWLTEDIMEAITDFSVSDIRIKEDDGELEISFIISNNKSEEVDKMIIKTNEEDLCNYLELKELNMKERLEELEQKK